MIGPRPRNTNRVRSRLVVWVALAVSGPAAAADTPGGFGQAREIGGLVDPVLGMAVLPDGHRVVTCGGSRRDGADNSLRLWDLETGKEVRRFVGHEQEAHGVAVSPDGRRLLSVGSDRTMRLWDVESGESLAVYRDSQSVLLTVAIAPDGRGAVTGGWDLNPLRVWDLNAGRCLRQVGAADVPNLAAAYAPDGRHALIGIGDGSARLWDLDAGKEVRRLAGHEGGVVAVAFSADGKRAFTGGGLSLRFWEVETGKELNRLEKLDPISAAAFSPDGRRALVASNTVIQVWGLDGGGLIGTLEGHEAWITRVAFTPDGRRAVSAGLDNTVRVWDVTSAPAIEGRTLAVLDFADLGPSIELAVLRKALAEMLIGDLTRDRGLRVVERGRAEQVLGEARLGKAGLIDPETARRAGRELAADLLLTGSLAGSPEKITIKAELTRPGTERPVGAWSVEGPSKSLFDLERELAAKVREALGTQAPKPGPAKPPPAVAVAGFKDLSPVPRLKEMESGFSEVLQAELASHAGLRLVERAKLDAVLREQKLSLSGLVAAESAAKVGRLIGAERMIFGSFMEIGTRLRVEARVVDTETAAVLHAETAEGLTESFAELFEGLAAKLAHDLSPTPEAPAPKRARAAATSRRLEAARHYALGKELSRQERYGEAAAAFERVLLVEPDNLDAHFWRTDAWYRVGDHAKVVEAALQGLNRTFTPQQRGMKDGLRSFLSGSYRATSQYQKHLDLLEQVIAEGPKSPEADAARVDSIGDLMWLNRRGEAMALVRAMIAEAEKSEDRAIYDKRLREFFPTLVTDLSLSRDVATDVPVAADLLERMLRAAETHRDAGWDGWALSFPSAIVVYYYEKGARKSLLTPEQQIDDIRRVIKAFPDLPRVRRECELTLARKMESLERWKEARESYLYAAGHLEGVTHWQVPCAWDYSPIWFRSDWLSQVIQVRVKAAVILADKLKDKPGATAELRAILHDYGMAHQDAAILGRLLREYGEPIEFPKKSALIVGGVGDGWQSWSHVLGPLGYTVHPFGAEMLTAANLAPYSLVVLVRQGPLAFQPSEVLAFRSYVATGGSLLVVVSPGWYTGQPEVLNPLLAFFGVHAHREALPTRVWGDLSDDHALVKGLERKPQMVKCGVELDAPRGSTVVRSGEKKVMVALPYREGRVVVTSFGQWLLPDISDMGEWWSRAPGRHTLALLDAAPILQKEDPAMLPLLKNAVVWLDEPISGRPEGRRLPEDFLKAHHVALEVLYRLRPEAELPPALDALVAGSGSGVRREEALWVAGESLKPLHWFHNESAMRYDWKDEEGTPRFDPRFFEELVGAFPKSELAPFARFEAAEFARLNRVFDVFREHGAWVDVPTDVVPVVPLFEKVAAPKGSYAWAWAGLRLGMLEYQAGHHEKALGHVLPVADVMEDGPEKVLALFAAVVSSKALGQTEQTARYLQSLSDAPEITFPAEWEVPAWAPFGLPRGKHRIRFIMQGSRTTATQWVQDLKKSGQTQ